jgi:hypothetical protein
MKSLFKYIDIVHCLKDVREENLRKQFQGKSPPRQGKPCSKLRVKIKDTQSKKILYLTEGQLRKLVKDLVELASKVASQESEYSLNLLRVICEEITEIDLACSRLQREKGLIISGAKTLDDYGAMYGKEKTYPCVILQDVTAQLPLHRIRAVFQACEPVGVH